MVGSKWDFYCSVEEQTDQEGERKNWEENTSNFMDSEFGES